MNNARRLSTLALVGLVYFLAREGSYAASWYVNPTAAGGANNGTSWANGWLAFDQITWGSVAPGDTVYLHGGVSGYTYSGSFLSPFTIGASGTAGNPITISIGQDAGHNGVANLTGQYIDLQGRPYIHITGNVGGAQNLWLTDFFDTANRTFANKVLADGTTGFSMDHCYASNVNQCVSLVGAQGFAIDSNTLIARGDAAVRAVNSPDNGFDSHTVSRNVIVCQFATNQPGFLGPDGIQASHGITVVSNYFTIAQVSFQTSSQHPDFTQIIGNHIKIYANYFLNIGDSGNDFDWWANPTPHDILIYNNVYNIDTAIDPFPEYIRWYVSAGNSITSLANFQVVANTFANNATWPNVYGRWGASGNPVLTNVRLADNIFYGGAFDVANDPVATGSTLSVSNNVYAPGFTYIWRGTNYSAAGMVAGPDASGVAGVPTFVGAADFHLASTNSVGWAAGLNYNSLFTTDKDGVVRGGTWDDGAYQFVGGNTNLPPNVPSNVTPANAATGVATVPTLIGSAYSDPQGNSQTLAQFQIYASDGVTLITDSFNVGAVNSWVSDVTLAYSTTYKWRWQVGSVVGASGFSPLTSFTTLAQPVSPGVKLRIDRLKTNQGRGKP